MSDDGREFAASVLEGAAELAEKIAAATGNPKAILGVGIGGTIANVVAGLVRTLGADGAQKAIEELKRRVDAGEGMITAADVEADDRYIDDYIAKLFESE